MKKIWIGLVVLLVAFNVLLAFIFIDKKALLTRSFLEMHGLPDVTDFTHISESVSVGLRHHTLKSTYELYNEFASLSDRFSRSIDALALKDYREDEISYFESKSSISSADQDSLWQSFQRYRKSVDKILATVLPERKAFYQRYVKVVAIARESDQSISAQRKKALQVSLDSAAILPQGVYEINIDDRKRLTNFISHLKFRSNPVEELVMNDLLNKMEEAFAARDKMMLYKKIILLDNVTPAERNQLYSYLVVLKARADKQLNILTR